MNCVLATYDLPCNIRYIHYFPWRGWKVWVLSTYIKTKTLYGLLYSARKNTLSSAAYFKHYEIIDITKIFFFSLWSLWTIRSKIKCKKHGKSTVSIYFVFLERRKCIIFLFIFTIVFCIYLFIIYICYLVYRLSQAAYWLMRPNMKTLKSSCLKMCWRRLMMIVQIKKIQMTRKKRRLKKLKLTDTNKSAFLRVYCDTLIWFNTFFSLELINNLQ